MKERSSAKKCEPELKQRLKISNLCYDASAKAARRDDNNFDYEQQKKRVHTQNTLRKISAGPLFMRRVNRQSASKRFNIFELRDDCVLVVADFKPYRYCKMIGS